MPAGSVATNRLDRVVSESVLGFVTTPKSPTTPKSLWRQLAHHDRPTQRQQRPVSDSGLSESSRRPIAAIDVGTNSVHVVVARPVNGGTPEILAREKVSARLGAGSQGTGDEMRCLDPMAVDRAIGALARFRRLADAFGAEIVAVATSAVRESESREVFLRRALQEAGVTVEVISGIEEARLIHLGAIGSVSAADRNHLVLDIGGGSTEIAIGTGTTPHFLRSLKLGHIRLTDRFFRSGEIKAGAIQACQRHVKSVVVPVAHEIQALHDECPPFEIAIGCSGTIENLAVMAAARAERLVRTANNLVLTRKDLDALVLDIFSRPTPAHRAQMPGLDESRRDVIVAGAIVLRQLFKALKVRSLTVSSGALREGVILDRIQRRAPHVDPLHHLSDLRRAGVVSAARRFKEDLTHEQHTTDLALELFDRTTALHLRGQYERDILEAAGLLHNVGRFVSHEAHHKHSYYLIRHSEHLAGFNENEVELIAQVGRYHRRSEPKPTHGAYTALAPEDQSRVRLLAGLLRVACALDSTYRQAVRQVASVAQATTLKGVADNRGGGVDHGMHGESPTDGSASDGPTDGINTALIIEIHTTEDADIQLELHNAGERAGLMADSLGRTVTFTVTTCKPAQPPKPTSPNGQKSNNTRDPENAAAGHTQTAFSTAFSSAPGWFFSAVANKPTQNELQCAGANIGYLHWGQPGQPALVFVHGGAAHAHWWSHIAPMFLPSIQIAAIDLSGHGDSDRRDEYSLQTWTDEVAAVVAALELPNPPVLIGHSMGGFVTIATAACHPELLGGAVIIDSPVIAEDPEVSHARSTNDFKTPKSYDDPRIPIAKFRTIPAQDTYLPYVKEHVARHSLRQLDSGRWTWKFDPSIFLPRRAHASHYLGQIRCRVALLRCEHGLVTPDIGEYMYEQLGRVAPVVELPTAGHHPMLDVPLILMTALRSLLADWDHSDPISGKGVPNTP